MRRRLIPVVLAGCLVTTISEASGAGADGPVEVIAAFEAAAGELPEGVVADPAGNLFVSLGPPFFLDPVYGAIRKIDPDGTQTTLVEYPDGPAPAGLALDRSGRLHFALPDPGGAVGGVYRLGRDGAERIAGTETMLVPNGLAFDRRRNLYVSDSLRGEIWRIPGTPRRGRGHDRHDARGRSVADPAATVWLADDLLAGCDGGVGANGVAVWRGAVYVANTSKGMLVRIPIERHGQPGEPEVVAGDADCDPDDDLFSIDGIAIDSRGNVFAALVLVHRLVRIDVRSGDVTPLLDADDGLWNPASVTFGHGSDRSTLLVANYAVLPPVPTANLGPAVLAVDVGGPPRAVSGSTAGRTGEGEAGRARSQPSSGADSINA